MIKNSLMKINGKLVISCEYNKNTENYQLETHNIIYLINGIKQYRLMELLMILM